MGIVRQWEYHINDNDRQCKMTGNGRQWRITYNGNEMTDNDNEKQLLEIKDNGE